MKKESIEIIEEILKKCNWWEKIIVRRNMRLVIKICNYIRIKTINSMLV